MSFNVSCGFSNISIEEGDKVRFIPLIQNKKGKFQTNLLSVDELFLPICFAIKGEYNGYGLLNNIEQNRNTELIESFTNLSINDFVSLIKDKDILSKYKSVIDNEEVFSLLESMTGMFVLETVYEDFILKQKKSIKKANNEWNAFECYLEKIIRIIDNFEKSGLDDMIRYQLRESNIISPINYYVFLYEYLPYLNELKELILEEFLVYEFMVDMNVCYKPTYHGLQNGDYNNLLKFEKFKTITLKNKIKGE